MRLATFWPQNGGPSKSTQRGHFLEQLERTWTPFGTPFRNQIFEEDPRPRSHHHWRSRVARRDLHDVFLFGRRKDGQDLHRNRCRNSQRKRRIFGAKVRITRRRVAGMANWRHCSGAEIQITNKRVTKMKHARLPFGAKVKMISMRVSKNSNPRRSVCHFRHLGVGNCTISPK